MGMTFAEFVTAALAYVQAHPEQRIGQALMNALRVNRPDVSRLVGEDVWEVSEGTHPALLVWFAQVEQAW